MKVTKVQLRRIIREAVKSKLREAIVPPPNTTLPGRATTHAASDHPDIDDAVNELTGIVIFAAEEMSGSGADPSFSDSVHPEVYNMLREAVDEAIAMCVDAWEDSEDWV